uniref:Uncharacterized protein n=1 Tax=Rhodosorus marinus TaxID=101924 RepID=A0A7S0BGY8_9RHOD|mmetsp:Transcript_1634/g.2507  ORF Transcript_1634/g.2507 Transcript_1634/m.2507 type:complete len:176 (+) Transcript_1634:101-628(+)
MFGFVNGAASGITGQVDVKRGTRRICTVRMAEDGDKKDFKGFGDAPKKQEPKKKSKNQIEREAAEARLEKMRKAGMPEYSIWLRQKGEDQWFPVGSLAVQRSSSINEAIFKNEEALWQGARRQYPKIAGKEEETEIGYKLSQFPDENVRLAVRPSEGNPVKNFFDKLLNPLNTDD